MTSDELLIVTVQTLETLVSQLYSLHAELDAYARDLDDRRDANVELRTGVVYGVHRATTGLGHLLNWTTARRNALQAEVDAGEALRLEAMDELPDHLFEGQERPTDDELEAITKEWESK